MAGKRKRKKIWKTLQCRIILFNVFIVVLVALIGSASTYYSAFQRSLKMTEQSMENKVGAISENYFVAYEEMMNIVLNCTGRMSLSMGSLDFTQQPSDRKQALVNSSIMSDYCAISGYGSYILKLMISDKNGNFIQAGNSRGSTNDFQAIKDKEWFQKEGEKDAGDYKLIVVDNPFFKANGEKMIPIVRSMDTSGHKKEFGWCFLGISVKLFEDELKKQEDGNLLVVTTEEGDVIASVNQDMFQGATQDKIIEKILGYEESQGTFQQNVDGSQCLVSYSKNPINGILIFEVMPTSSIQDEKALLLYLAVFLFFSCLILGAVLSVVFSHQLKKPISRLSEQVRRIGNGDFSYNPAIESQDELGEIGEGINRMSKKISMLLEKSVEDEREKKDLEIKMLQAQINPHFLYNTLDSIRWIALIQKSTSIVKMVTALSGLLRNMAKGFNEKVTLREELKLLDDYIVIEKMRYMEMFDVDIYIAEEILYQAKIIKLTLQPLVENAIFSGIEPSGKNGTIRICVWKEGEELFISVRDSGVGMSREKIEKIMDKSRKKESSINGIGLPNVDQRVKLVYGEKYGLKINSVEGKYTEILLELPLEYDQIGKRG